MAGSRIIILHGPPACGKLTIARELAAMSGINVFHNHLTVDLLLAVFPFGSAEFVALRERIWLEVMTAATREGRSLIFTFNPERTVRPEFIPALVNGLRAAGGTVDFVEIRCSEDEIERRLGAPSRAGTGKLTSLEFYRQLRAEGAFDVPPMPEPAVVVDSSTLEAPAAARQISAALGL